MRGDDKKRESFDEGNGSWAEGSGEMDTLPEYCQYNDDGCEYAPSCLNCPFERCIYDEPGGKQGFNRKMRDREMVRLFTRDKKSLAELAGMFDVSRRTVQRALKRAGDDGE